MNAQMEVMAHAGALAGDYITVSWRPSAKPNKYQIVANVGGAQTVIGEFIVPNSPFAGRLPVRVKAEGPFTVAGDAAAMSAMGSLALFSASGPGGAFAYDPATTEMLGAAGAHVPVERSTPRAGA